MTIDTVFAIAGIAALFIGIFGGGVRIKEIKIPPMQLWARVLISITGIVLMFISIFLSKPELIQPALAGEETSQATEIPATPTSVIQAETTYNSEAVAVITSPENYSFVENEQEVSGSLTKVKSDESAFLCVEKRSENPLANCYGKLKTNMVDLWSIPANFNASNQPYDMYVVVSANTDTIDILTKSQRGGVFIDQLPDVEIISNIHSVTSK